jgi:hypothetical protein
MPTKVGNIQAVFRYIFLIICLDKSHILLFNIILIFRSWQGNQKTIQCFSFSCMLPPLLINADMKGSAIIKNKIVTTVTTGDITANPSVNMPFKLLPGYELLVFTPNRVECVAREIIRQRF